VLFVVRWQIFVDFLVLAAAFYALLRWARSARALRIALAVVGLHAVALLARHLDLVITSWLLDGAAILAIILLLLIFQPELRRALMRLDSVLQRWPRRLSSLSEGNHAIAEAAFALAQARVGALIVVARRDSIAELVDGGIALEAITSLELLEAIFQKDSPLHDGAAIIDGDRLLKAGVVLPLTQRRDVPGFYGTRHRAGMGLAERSDAQVIVVSEERGKVTLMSGSKLQQHMADRDQLITALEQVQSVVRESGASRLRRYLLVDLGLKLAALGLAVLIWSMSYLASGTTIRTVSAPVEFSNVPAGMEITEQSADTLEIQVRGSPWVMDSVSLGKLIANFDLRSLHPGTNTLRLAPGTLDLPPGVAVDRVIPDKIRVVAVRSETRRPQEK